MLSEKKKSFGIIPFSPSRKMEKGARFSHTENPFYGSDFRGWRVIHRSKSEFDQLGAKY
ncbi:MAG: hypothetical protein IPG53_06230 [Ignavibacteriales bacterium]|nr:hypothetical protein [Ignavibacteriales bacterium]